MTEAQDYSCHRFDKPWRRIKVVLFFGRIHSPRQTSRSAPRESILAFKIMVAHRVDIRSWCEQHQAHASAYEGKSIVIIELRQNQEIYPKDKAWNHKGTKSKAKLIGSTEAQNIGHSTWSTKGLQQIVDITWSTKEPFQDLFITWCTQEVPKNRP
jgi:hypothetical protein